MLSALLVVWLATSPAAEQQAPPDQAGGVTVSGRIVDAYPGAQPQPDAVQMRRADSPMVPPSVRIPINPDGTFTADNIAPGRYELQAAFSYSTTIITVGSAPVHNVDVVVGGQTRFEPTARMDDGSAVPPGVVFRVQMEPHRFLAVGPNTLARLSLPPGAHWIFFSLPAGLHVQSASSAGVDLLRHRLEVSPGAPSRPVDVVLTRTPPDDVSTVRITGVVGREAGLEVELVDTTNVSRVLIARTTTTTEGGTYRFDGLPRGIYTLNLPPVDRVAVSVEAGAGEVRIDVPVPPGARLVGGDAIPIHVGERRMIPIRPAGLTIVAEGNGTSNRIPIDSFMGFWGTLSPGRYRLAVDGLDPGYSVRSLAAGSVNLLEQPFTVPLDRPAETIRLELNYTEPR